LNSYVALFSAANSSSARTCAVGIAVYLALHGPATGPGLDDALWNGQRIDPRTRASLIYRTRRRAGEDVLPVVGRWQPLRLGDAVTTDWSLFQQAVARSLMRDGPERIDELTNALSLVRGRPLRGIGGGEYAWADYDIHHMVSAIADMAHTLARLLQESGLHRQALGAWVSSQPGPDIAGIWADSGLVARSPA
jgi:hypothetical protein